MLRLGQNLILLLWLLVLVAMTTVTTAVAQDKYPPSIVPLSQEHGFFTQRNSFHFWAYAPYSIGQKTDASCSVTSVTMLINAIRSTQKLSDDDRLATEALTLAKANSPDWIARTSEASHSSGKFKGVPLDLLQTYLEPALLAWGIRVDKIETIHIDQSSPEELARFRADLAEFESSPKVWLLVNYDQGLVMNVESVGHIAPIAAYDKARRRVLVMDPDKAWYEPYWAPDTALFRAMATWGEEFHRNRGYLKIYLK